MSAALLHGIERGEEAGAIRHRRARDPVIAQHFEEFEPLRRAVVPNAASLSIEKKPSEACSSVLTRT
jgi:hypothetical protein